VELYLSSSHIPLYHSRTGAALDRVTFRDHVWEIHSNMGLHNDSIFTFGNLLSEFQTVPSSI